MINENTRIEISFDNKFSFSNCEGPFKVWLGLLKEESNKLTKVKNCSVIFFNVFLLLLDGNVHIFLLASLFKFGLAAGNYKVFMY